MSSISSDESRKILQILSQDGGEGRFVGGCVRDHLLHKDYTDIDIATTHVPEKVIELMNNEGVKTIPTGIDHGTITAILNGCSFEITSLRKDLACDGRHADVEFTTDWQEDASRRDFTINAIYMAADGEIHDYFGGQDDLKERIVRFVGKPADRIKEDYLRILRMFRFQSYYGEEFLPNQVEACSLNLDGVQGLSGERIQSEMLKILSSPKPLHAIMVMNKIGLFKHIIVAGEAGDLGLGAFRELLKIERCNKDILPINPYIRLAAMLIIGNTNKEKILVLAERWKLSSDDRNFLCQILNQEHQIRSDIDIALAKKEIRALTKEYFIATCFVRWAAERCFCDDNHEAIDLSYRKIVEMAIEWKVPIMPIRGRDMLDMGLDEGKEIGSLLRMAEDYWEDGGYKSTREELLALVRS